MIKQSEIRALLEKNELKVTIPRIMVYEALLSSNEHPTAEQVIKKVHKKSPSISQGTIYKTLESFVEKGIIRKVKNDEDFMRYDAFMEMHHHLYCEESDKIQDYYDDELNQMLTEYFKNKQIPDFEIKDIQLQINGKFSNNKH